jgi:hypothetical protein
MSCYIVGAHHISAIIRWACENNIKTGYRNGRYLYQPGQEQEAVSLLHAANVRSANERYNGSDLEVAEYSPKAPRLTPVQVIRAIDGLDYQCDNWSDWEGSDAQHLLRSLKDKACMELPGYEQAEWHIAAVQEA